MKKSYLMLLCFFLVFQCVPNVGAVINKVEIFVAYGSKDGDGRSEILFRRVIISAS